VYLFEREERKVRFYGGSGASGAKVSPATGARKEARGLPRSTKLLPVTKIPVDPSLTTATHILLQQASLSHPITMAEVSLSDFVNAQREKKRREALAQQFLGSQARRGSAPGAGVVNARAKDQKPTLLSRMSGVQKRSSSAKPTTNIDGKWQHDLHRVNNPNGPASKKLNRTVSTPHLPRNARTEDQFVAIFNGNAQSARTNNAGPKFNGGAGFSIKGSASRGPYTIIASNFAPGTTGSDIEEVMAPHGMGTFLAARVIMPGPTVMAEIDFDSKDGADNVIQVFNNQKVRLVNYVLPFQKPHNLLG
jgi:hypothetical protein